MRLTYFNEMNPLPNPVILGKMAKSYFYDVDRVKKKEEREIKKYQDKSLRRLIKYAYTVPIYYEKFKKNGIRPNDINGIKDITKLPFITKKDIRKSSYDKLLPKKANVNEYNMVSTSGSSGKPVSLFYDPYSLFLTFIGFIRVIKEHNISWNKTKIAVIADLSTGSIEEAYYSKTAIPSLRFLFSLNNIKAFDISEKLEVLIGKIESFNPELIVSYPGFLHILAILKRQGKCKGLEPQIVATSGAVVDNYTREYIEKTFNAKLFDVYGATECNPMAYECINGNYHILGDFVHIEFINPEEKEKLTGDGGNIIITRLFGKGTPIIRYTGICDFVVESNRKCECNINTPLIERIEGRKVDFITLPNGNMIPPSAITGIPYKVMKKFHTDKIQQFQIIQQKSRNIDILMIVDEQLRNSDPPIEKIFGEMKEQFRKTIGKDVTISIKEVERITSNRPHSATPPPVVISKVNNLEKSNI